MKSINERGYKNPDILVSTDWVAENLNTPNLRLVESNEDALLYSSGHIPGAVEIDWTTDLNNPLIRDYLNKDDFSELLNRNGITNDTTVIFYGDKNNWWACYAFWIFQLFGHTKAKIMDGGRLKWEKEKRDLSREKPEYPRTEYKTNERDDSVVRAFREEVLEHMKKTLPMIDVRSPEEFSGERMHMPDYPNEGALRGGHIPGAVNVPWAKAINTEDGTFKSESELTSIYKDLLGSNKESSIITYCRIGERSSHTWFVLKYLLGFPNVKNYDGSWTEWGNLVGAPIEK